MSDNQTITNEDKSFGIYHDLIIESSIEKLFSAVTEPKHLINWWPLKCAGTPKLDSEYNFYFSPEYNWYGKVIKYIPHHCFYIKMTKSDLDWNTTSFGFAMKEDDGYTKLQFSHTGWVQCNSHFRTSSYCWAMLLKGLKDYMEKGLILPFEERN